MDPLKDSRLISLLDRLEQAIDCDTEEILRKDWENFWEKGSDTPFFSPERKKKQQFPVPSVSLNDTLSQDTEGLTLLLIREYAGCLSALAGNGQLCVRANYGVGILPSLFGAEFFYMPQEYQQLPNVRPLGLERMEGQMEKGVPPLKNGCGGMVLAAGECMAEIARRYPNIGRFVWCYHPDLQGPMDAAELLCGSELFYQLADDPQWVHQLLGLLTNTYCALLEAWWDRVGYGQEFSCHWGMVQKGRVMLREDSAMNLSSQMVEDYLLPYDREILSRYGGCLHVCGKGDHYLSLYAPISGFYGINMSQPEYNDMEQVYRFTIDQGKRIIGLNRSQARTDCSRLFGRVMAL